MARVDEHGVHPVAQVDELVIFAGVNKLRHPLGVGHGIQRLLLRPPARRFLRFLYSASLSWMWAESWSMMLMS